MKNANYQNFFNFVGTFTKVYTVKRYYFENNLLTSLSLFII